MNNYTPIDFPELLGMLGISGPLALCSSHGDVKDARVSQDIVDPSGAFKRVEMWKPYDNIWFSVNELRTGARSRTKADIARLTALYLDLDVKAGSFDSMEACQDFAAFVGRFYGRPADVLISSGGGLQPLWILEDTPERRDPEGMRRELNAFKEDAYYVAEFAGVKLDSVFDTSRILRVPGTLNHKYATKPATSAVRLEVSK